MVFKFVFVFFVICSGRILFFSYFDECENHVTMEGPSFCIRSNQKASKKPGGDSAGQEPGIIQVPPAMKDVLSTFSICKAKILSFASFTMFLFRVYNESIIDILALPGLVAANPVQIKGGVEPPEGTSFW